MAHPGLCQATVGRDHRNITAMTMTSCTLFFLMLLTLIPAITARNPDFVIIGAGTSGSVLAARLCSSLPKANILLLERGVSRNAKAEFLINSPRQSFNAWASPLVSEIFPSLPNKGLFGKSQIVITGNTLGGSSAINGLQWTVPAGDSVDSWDVTGLSSKVAGKFFRRAFRKVGFKRPKPEFQHLYAGVFLKAARAAGFVTRFEPFSNRVRKAVWLNALAATREGRRTDSYTAYVKPVLNGRCRRNLKVLQGVTVTRLLLGGEDEESRRVRGVEYVESGDKAAATKKNITLNEEVFLAAGPYGSPKLLQLSGIGQASHLRRAGVKPIIELEVGAGTQARAINGVVSVYKGAPLEPANNSTLLRSREQRKRWENGQSSVLGIATNSINGILEKQAYIALLHGFPNSDLDMPLLLSGCVGNPTSRGFLRIKNSDPFAPPDVQLNLLGKHRDVRRLRRCINQSRAVFELFAKSFQLQTVLPAGNVTDAFLRNTSSHGLHFVGGCRVGKVLHGNLKVRGVDGVRVVDASVLGSMPVSAGPMASTYMLAEFASERISCVYEDKFGVKKSCRTKGNVW